MAFQKGILKGELRSKPSDSQRPEDLELDRMLYGMILSYHSEKERKINYPAPYAVYERIFPWFNDRAKELIRRNDAVSLGVYQMGDIAQFFGGFFTVCAVHKQLVHGAHTMGCSVENSVVIVKDRLEWKDLLGQITSLEDKKIEAIMTDLLFREDQKTIDLHTTMFIPLDKRGLLAVAPDFVLSSKPEDILLRTCSRKSNSSDPTPSGSISKFDETTGTKEQEMLDDLKKCCPSNFRISGPFTLPKAAKTNIDLVIEDTASSTVLIAELKWLRKPNFVKEWMRADHDLVDGMDRQLTLAKQYVEANPCYLVDRRAISKPIDEYLNVFYCLIARDHIMWIDPREYGFLLEHEVFKMTLSESNNLDDVLRQLLKYDWLPVEGRDFTVQRTTALVNGITLEGATFFARGF